MDGYKAYRLYLAIKLHFTTDSYNVFEKMGAVKYTREQFNKRNDKTIYEKMATKYSEKDWIQFLVANLAYGNLTPVYEIEESESYQLNWIKRKESITQIVKNDLSVIINDAYKNNLKKDSVLDFTFNQQPSILTLFIGNRISLESVSILNDFLELSNLWVLSGFVMTFWESEIRRINKVNRFVKYDKERIFPLIQEFESELLDL